MLAKTVFLIIFISFLVNGILTLANKWEIINYFQGTAKTAFFQKLWNCLFCISHHLAFILCACWCLYDFQWLFIFVPLSVAGVINKIN